MGAFVYSVYLVTLKHQVGNEENLNIAMFYGFVGVFNMVLIGPGLYLFHALGWEKFELPQLETFGYIAVNGLVGTVLSEFLWLWGCFLTSSLAATLSLSMTTPLSMLTDAVFRHQHFSWHLYVGSVSVVSSFLLVTLFQQYNNWDPVGQLFYRVCSKHNSTRGRRHPIRNMRRSPSSGSIAAGANDENSESGSNGTRKESSCGNKKLKRAARGATRGVLGTMFARKKKKTRAGVRLKVDSDDGFSSDDDTQSLVSGSSDPQLNQLSPTPSTGERLISTDMPEHN